MLQVVLAPDPDLAEHLLLHGVMVAGSTAEGNRLQHAFLIQVFNAVLAPSPKALATCCMACATCHGSLLG